MAKVKVLSAKDYAKVAKDSPKLAKVWAKPAKDDYKKIRSRAEIYRPDGAVEEAEHYLDEHQATMDYLENENYLTLRMTHQVVGKNKI